MYKAISVLFGGAFIGKFLGVARELLFAFFYGTTSVVSAFKMAQTIVLIPSHLICKDILHSGFLPTFKKLNETEARRLFVGVSILLFVFSLIIFVTIYLFIDILVTMIAPGFSENTLEITIKFVKIFSFGLPFYILSTFFSYVQMAKEKFLLNSILSIVQNIGTILFLILSWLLHNILLMAYGFVFAYMILFFIGFKSVYKLYLQDKIYEIFITNKISWSMLWKNTKPLIWLPIMLQANIFTERLISTLIGVETLASLEYARFLTETIIFLAAAPIAMASLNYFSVLSKEEISCKLSRILPLIFIVSIPLSQFFFLYSKDIVSFLYARGTFDTQAIYTTSTILKGLSIGLWAQTGAYVLMKALSANFNNRTMVFYMLISLAINSLFNIVFYNILGYMTLGLGVSLYGFILLCLGLNYFKLYPKLIYTFLKLLLGALIYMLFFILLKDYNFFINILCFMLFWFLFYFFQKNFKMAILDIITKSTKGKR